MPRKILHIDLDAFFCSVEELLNPSLKGKEFAVGGQPNARGVVASCSYAARMNGVHSAMPMSQAVRLCPGLIIIPGRHSIYSNYSQRVMNHIHDITPGVQQISIDEAFLDVSDLPETGGQIAERLQGSINQDPGLPCSIGVATNKLMAKIATNVGKSARKGPTPPNAITIVPPGEENTFLAPLEIGQLWGVGPKTANRLVLMGVKTIGDLSRLSEKALVSMFGKYGHDIYQHASGIDNSPVESGREAKSISQETTFDRDIADKVELIRTLQLFSENVGQRLREENLVCSTIKIKLRWPDFTTLTRQMSLSQPTDQDNTIYLAVRELFDNLWLPGKPVRLLGVGASQLGAAIHQLSLWDTPGEKEHRLLEAVDGLRDRYGQSIIRRGDVNRIRRRPDLSQPMPFPDEEMSGGKREGPLTNSYWVIPGRLLAGPYPGGSTETETRSRLNRLLQAGINSFIDLTEPGELNLLAYDRFLKQRSQININNIAIHYKRMPIPDMDAPEDKVMVSILSTIHSLLANGNNVYIHCYAGRGRTGTVVGCFLVAGGQSGKNALEQIRQWRSNLPDGIIPSPETGRQRKMILEWSSKNQFSE